MISTRALQEYAQEKGQRTGLRVGKGGAESTGQGKKRTILEVRVGWNVGSHAQRDHCGGEGSTRGQDPKGAIQGEASHRGWGEVEIAGNLHRENVLSSGEGTKKKKRKEREKDAKKVVSREDDEKGGRPLGGGGSGVGMSLMTIRGKGGGGGGFEEDREGEGKVLEAPFSLLGKEVGQKNGGLWGCVGQRIK